MAEPLLTGTIPVPEEGSVLPDSYDFERGESRAAVLARMQKAMTDTLAELWPKRAPGIAVSTPARSGDPGLDRREGDRRRARAADGRRALFEPGQAGHAAAGRPDDHLPDHQGQAARPPHPPVGDRGGQRLQHLHDGGPAAAGRSPTRAAPRSRRCSTRRRPTRCTWSPTARAGTCSRARSTSTTPTSPGGSPSAARAARCDRG